MDGKLNCSMTAENAAFTKLRHLENRVTETEAKLDNVEQQVVNLDGDLQEALTNLQEEVSTESVETTSLNANEAEVVNLTSTNIETANLNATTIEAETIDVDNLENVNVLHGQTVDVARTIADIGQFQETHTTTANNGTTNTEELNVSTEANLTGQVNIDGNMTFTKDNGLSKLQGNYLEIDAANIVIDNKNSAEYALYVPGVDGDALFGGSVAVQDTLAAKNLMVAETAVINNAQLGDNTVLTNPTLADIRQTQEVSSTCIDLDEDGKLIRVNIGTSSEVVATALKSVVDDVEKVNISAEGAVFNVPVTVNETATINTADITSLAADNVTAYDITAETIIINDKATIEDIETSTIDAEAVKTIGIEVDGMTFYEGEWYHKKVYNKQELLSFIANNTEDKTFKILYVGASLNLIADDFPSIDTVLGNFKIYNANTATLTIYMEEAHWRFYYAILNSMEFYKFDTTYDFNGINYSTNLHVNDCSLTVVSRGITAPTNSITMSKCTNVEFTLESSIADTREHATYFRFLDCTNCKTTNLGVPTDDSSYRVTVSIDNSNGCYAGIKCVNLAAQLMHGGNSLVVNTNTKTIIQPTVLF